MNKLGLINGDKDKKIITFTINASLKESIRDTLVNSEKYNLKKKSDWVNEAILMLQVNPDYKELVYNAEGSSGDFVFDKIYMTFHQRCVFAEMRSQVVKTYTNIQGPQGAIIRAAILSRLTRKL